MFSHNFYISTYFSGQWFYTTVDCIKVGLMGWNQIIPNKSLFMNFSLNERLRLRSNTSPRSESCAVEGVAAAAHDPPEQ